MAVHQFGAISSPGCANFGLKKAADDGREEFGSAAADFIYYDVDDGLTSLPTVHEALELLVKTQQICAKHGIILHTFASNSKTLLMSIAAEDRSVNLHNIESVVGSNMNEKALGVEWSIEKGKKGISCLAEHEWLIMHDQQNQAGLTGQTGCPEWELATRTRLFHHDPSTKGLKVFTVIFN